MLENSKSSFENVKDLTKVILRWSLIQTRWCCEGWGHFIFVKLIDDREKDQIRKILIELAQKVNILRLYHGKVQYIKKYTGKKFIFLNTGCPRKNYF